MAGVRLMREFKVIEAGWSEELQADAVILKCTAAGYGEKFQVVREAFKEGRIRTATSQGALDVRTRPCPYCFYMSELPTSAPTRSR